MSDIASRNAFRLLAVASGASPPETNSNPIDPEGITDKQCPQTALTSTSFQQLKDRTMTTSPVFSSESPTSVPGRQSRGTWLLATAVLTLLVVGWIGNVVIASRYRAEQVVRDNRQPMQQLPLTSGVSQTIPRQSNASTFAVNQQITQAYSPNTMNTQFNTSPVQYNNLQQSPQPNTTYYAYPTPAPNRAEDAATNEINKLLNQLRTAAGDQKKELRKSLTEAVGKLFDLRHATQAKQVEKLEAELAEAKELLQKRGDRKDEIVDRRIAELLQSADDLAWNREVANQPRPATNYPVVPKTYAPSSLPSGYYPVPPAASYPSNSYGTQLNFPPTPYYSNPPPLSSTPTQLIPMSTQSSLSTGSIEPAPSARGAYSAQAPSSAPLNSSSVSGWQSSNTPAVRSTTTAGSQKNWSTFENQPDAESTTTQPSAKSNDLTIGTYANSKVVIEAAYAYEEALDLAIETKQLSTSGAVSAREQSTCKRNAAKAKAIWEATLQDLEHRRKALEQEGRGLEARIEASSAQEQRAAMQAELEKAKLELVSAVEAQAMAEHFRLSLLERLEKQLEQTAETKSEEQKPAPPTDQ
jgi:hypothetical protein